MPKGHFLASSTSTGRIFLKLFYLKKQIKQKCLCYSRVYQGGEKKKRMKEKKKRDKRRDEER